MAYICHTCSAGIRQSGVGVAVGVASAALLIAALLFSYLRGVVKDRAGDDLEVARGFREQKCLDCQSFVVNMLPLTTPVVS